MRKWIFGLMLAGILAQGVRAAGPIRWVDFDVSCEAMEAALELDMAGQEQEAPWNWLDLLALAACRTGGRVRAPDVERAGRELESGSSPEELLGDAAHAFRYYRTCYEAALGGLVGNFAVSPGQEAPEQWKSTYGLKAFSPIAAGWSYSHYEDFGASRSFGYARRHLGNDLLGQLGTPIVAVEGGTVEALGWNVYGGWRVGIRSRDGLRYYYYAHLQKDHPYAPGLKVGDSVNAGDVIGFMGRTGYSRTENVNNIEAVHLHFGLQLIFDESQKDGDGEIWIDVFQIVRFLDRHRSTVARNPDGTWSRVYPYQDLDLPQAESRL